ncbi:MAG: ABC transporter permease [Candidatus Eremiobacteraeota bacterium]|nr:ABC transporter permease [Candidatus Eremiobacteraeota bacterium]MBV8355075.1 ABC transporter permease [Candidatus Eremiobacteraeota bacterium]
MTAYVVRRIFGAVWVLIGCAVVVFFIVHLSGDPAAIMLPPEATQADIAAFRHAEGFDRPLYDQFITFAVQALHGNFGDSLRHNVPALSLALERVPATLELAFTAMLIAVIVAVPSGVISALRPNTALDFAVRIFALLGQSAPTYWIGLMLILVFGVWLGWLPVSGMGGLSHLIMPAVTLGLFSMAKLMRLTRGALLDVLHSDFLRTALAKGVGRWRLIGHHAMRNAWLPIITQIGVELGTLLAGAIITETIFAWPGIGRLAIQAIYDRDFPVVEVVVLLAAGIFVVVNTIVDLGYAALDPRIRYD